MTINIKTISDDLVYFLCFVTFLLPWFSLSRSSGGFEIRLFHFAILILLLKKVFSKKITVTYTPKAKMISLLFFLCYVLFFVSIFWSNNILYGLSFFFKNFVYFTFFILVSDFFLRDIDNFKSKIIKYSKWSIYTFILINIIVDIAAGESIFFKSIKGVFTGDAKKSNYFYFIKIVNFNFSDFSFKTWRDPGFVIPKFRNVFGISTLILYSIIDLIPKPSKWERFLKLFLIILILFSQSRSTMIIFAAIFVLKFLVNSASKKIFFIVLFAPIVAFIFILFIDVDIFNRFLDLGKDSRIVMYYNTIIKIFNNSFFGSGFGTKIDFLNNSFHVHNFILAGMLSSGILGLILTVTIVLDLLIKTYNRIKFNTLNYHYYFIYGVPILFLVRMMVGGNNGLPSFQDWISLSIFFMVLHLNNNLKENIK